MLIFHQQSRSLRCLKCCCNYGVWLRLTPDFNITKAHNATKCNYSTVRFLTSMKYRCCEEGRSIKYNTTRRAIQLLQFVKGLRAGWFCLADRIRAEGGRLPTPGLESDSARSNIHPNNKQLPEIANKNTGKIRCQYGRPVWVWKVLRNLCRDFHLHFQVFWLTPQF